MKVSKELLEKYHSGHCNDQEKILVEAWLCSEEYDVDTMGLDDKQKNALKEEIWGNLKSETVDVLMKNEATQSRKLLPRLFWLSTAAAVLLFFCEIAFMLFQNSTTKQLTARHQNTLAPIDQEAVQMVLGQGSHAFFDSNADRVDFCGLVKITPKMNIKIAFATGCENSDNLQKEVFMTEGKTYFALDLKDAYRGELVVMSEDNIYELPPLVRNAIRAQFGI